jgi:hypothetical protein
MLRTSNRESGRYVQNLVPFQANNLHAERVGGKYVVYSYGWYPVFIYAGGQWFENEARYSVSTAKQMTQCRPAGAQIVSRETMEQILNSRDQNLIDLLEQFLTLTN